MRFFMKTEFVSLNYQEKKIQGGVNWDRKYWSQTRQLYFAQRVLGTGSLFLY